MNIPQCTHDIPPRASWYLADVLNIPLCTYDIPNVLMVPPDVLNTHYTGWLPEHFAEATKRRTPRKTMLHQTGSHQVLQNTCQQIIYTSFKQTVHPSNSQGKWLMLTISHFVLLSQPLFVHCLFEKIY